MEIPQSRSNPLLRSIHAENGQMNDTTALPMARGDEETASSALPCLDAHKLRSSSRRKSLRDSWLSFKERFKRHATKPKDDPSLASFTKSEDATFASHNVVQHHRTALTSDGCIDSSIAVDGSSRWRSKRRPAKHVHCKQGGSVLGIDKDELRR